MKRWIALGLLTMISMTSVAGDRAEPKIGWSCRDAGELRSTYVKWYQRNGKIVSGSLCYDVGISNKACRSCAMRQAQTWCKNSLDKENQWCRVYESLKDDT